MTTNYQAGPNRSLAAKRLTKFRAAIKLKNRLQSGKVSNADQFSMEQAQFRTANQFIDSLVRNSDTFAVLCDINCHRWIVWLMDHSILFPSFYVPTTEHFTFGSVHDVSHRVYQRSRKNWAYFLWNLLFFDNFFGPSVSDRPETPQQRPIVTVTRSSQFNPNVPNLPSDLFIQTSSVQLQPNPSPSPSESKLEPKLSTSVESIVTNPSPLSSPTTIIAHSERCSNSTAKHETNGGTDAKPSEQTQPKECPQQEVDEAAARDDQISSSHPVPYSSCYKYHLIIVSIFYLTVSLRYACHLAWLMLVHRNSLSFHHYLWSPILVSMLTSTSSTLCMFYVFLKKVPIEDLIISSASFLKPLSNCRRRLVRILPRIYFILNLVLILVDLGTSLFQQRPLWYWHQTWHQTWPLPTAPSNRQSNHWQPYHLNLQHLPLLPLSPESSPNRTVDTFLSNQTEPFDNDPQPNNNLTVFTSVNHTTSNTTSELSNSSAILFPVALSLYKRVPIALPPSNQNQNLSNAIRTEPIWPGSSSTWLAIFYYLDLAIRAYVAYTFLLVKTFYFSLSLLIVLKCAQLCTEVNRQTSIAIRKARAKLRQQQQQRHKQSTCGLSSWNCDFVGNRSKSAQKINHTKPTSSDNPNNSGDSDTSQKSKNIVMHKKIDSIKQSSHPVPIVDQRENERLSILTQVLLDNIRRFDQIFWLLSMIWLLFSGIVLATICEFIYCLEHCCSGTSSELKSSTSYLNSSGSPRITTLTELIFLFASAALQTVDLLLLILVVCTIRIYRKKLLTS